MSLAQTTIRIGPEVHIRIVFEPGSFSVLACSAHKPSANDNTNWAGGPYSYWRLLVVCGPRAYLPSSLEPRAHIGPEAQLSPEL